MEQVYVKSKYDILQIIRTFTAMGAVLVQVPLSALINLGGPSPSIHRLRIFGRRDLLKGQPS
jgi:hypothetical protein